MFFEEVKRTEGSHDEKNRRRSPHERVIFQEILSRPTTKKAPAEPEIGVVFGG
jgi:hypothetical protein